MFGHRYRYKQKFILQEEKERKAQEKKLRDESLALEKEKSTLQKKVPVPNLFFFMDI